MNMQYGCGLCAPAGWINFDASPSLFFIRIPLFGPIFQKKMMLLPFPQSVRFGNILTDLSISKGSCSLVYCSHVLEHLSLDDLRTALHHTYSYLQEGGTFRFVLPDLEQLARDYVFSSEADAAIRFLCNSSLGQISRSRTIMGKIRELFGNSKHLWMWDYKSISFELSKVGFIDIRRAYFGDSIYKSFASVEDQDRWKDALGIECKRP